MTAEKYFKLKIETHKDSQTSAEVQRFVHETQSQEQAFPPARGGMSANEQFIPCWSNVSGFWEIHSIDRKEKVSRRLTDFHLDIARPENVPVSAACYAPETNRVFFPSGQQVHWVNVENMESGWLFEVPAGYQLVYISARGSFLVFSYYEDIPAPKLSTDTTLRSKAIYYRPQSVIVSINVNTGEADYVWGNHTYFTHIEMSPFDENMVMFVEQSPGSRHQTVSTVTRTFMEDKEPFHVMSAGGAEFRGSTQDYLKHFFFTRDGYIAAQYNEFGGLDRRGNYLDEAGFNMVIHPDGTCKRKAKFPGSKMPAHVHCQHSERFWVSDQFIQPDGHVEHGQTCLIRNRFESQELEMFPLLQTGHKGDEFYHVHPWMSPREDTVLMSYNTGNADSHMTLVQIPPQLLKIVGMK